MNLCFQPVNKERAIDYKPIRRGFNSERSGKAPLKRPWFYQLPHCIFFHLLNRPKRSPFILVGMVCFDYNVAAS